MVHVSDEAALDASRNVEIIVSVCWLVYTDMWFRQKPMLYDSTVELSSERERERERVNLIVATSQGPIDYHPCASKGNELSRRMYAVHIIVLDTPACLLGEVKTPKTVKHNNSTCKADE